MPKLGLVVSWLVAGKTTPLLPVVWGFLLIVFASRLSADLGLPPPMGPAAHMYMRILGHVKDQLPTDFLHHLDLQRYAVRSAAVLTRAHSNTLQTSFLELLEHDLGAVEDNMQQPLSPTVEIDLLAAKLRLYAIPLLTSQGHTTTSPERISSRVAWYKGFHVAMQLASLFTDKSKGNISDLSPLTPTNSFNEARKITSFHPKYYFCVLVMTAMYLIKLMAVDDQMSARDKTLARSRIQEVQTTLMLGSRNELDEQDRAAKMIKFLSDHVGDTTSFAPQDPEGNVETSPSIIDDGIRTAWVIRLKSSDFRGEALTNSQEFGGLINSETLVMDSTMNLSWDDLSGWDTWFGGCEGVGPP